MLHKKDLIDHITRGIAESMLTQGGAIVPVVVAEYVYGVLRKEQIPVIPLKDVAKAARMMGDGTASEYAGRN